LPALGLAFGVAELAAAGTVGPLDPLSHPVRSGDTRKPTIKDTEPTLLIFIR
jgi:hypothetical protein